MRVVVKEFGEDPMEALEKHVVVEPQPPPDPASLRPTDVIVAVKAAAVHWVDLLMTSGQYQHMPKPPYCPGLEFCGEVVWVGAEAKAKIGDSVIVDGLLAGPRSKGDYQGWGGFETYAVAPDAALVPLPKFFSFDQAASFFANFETAYHCLVACGDLQKGETVLVLGASGASGLAAVQLAKVLGATVIAAGRSKEKLAIVKSHGADHVVLTEENGNPRSFKDDIKAITGGRGVQVVYDAVGGATSIESLRCVDFGARFLIVGWASTPAVAKGKGQRGAPNANVLPTNLILMKGLKVLGCPMAISTHRDPTIRDERVARLLAWAESGALVPLVSATFPIAQAKEAMKAKWESRHTGGIVLHPQDL